jgi:hypothetical protein
MLCRVGEAQGFGWQCGRIAQVASFGGFNIAERLVVDSSASGGAVDNTATDHGEYDLRVQYLLMENFE